MATLADEEVRLGEDWVFSLQCRDGAGEILDLTGAAVKWRITDGDTIIIDAAIGTGLTVPTPANGLVYFRVTPAQQSAFVGGRGYDHEAQVVMADGSKSDQAYGIILVHGSLFG